MQFLRMVSSTDCVDISLKQQQLPIKSQTTINNQKYEYVSSLLIINQNTICAISQSALKFFSISGEINKQTNSEKKSEENHQLIGSIRVDRQVREQFNIYHHKQSSMESMTEKQMPMTKQEAVLKEMNFDRPSIIQEKGVIYDQNENKFFLLVSTQQNKYLFSFTVSFLQRSRSSDLNYEPSRQVEHQKYVSSKCKIKMSNFMVVYNFAIPNEVIRYNLEMDPELLYLQQSETLVLIRKFYSDSLVIVFRLPQLFEQTQAPLTTVNSLDRNSSNESDQAYLTLINKKSQHSKNQFSTKGHQQFHARKHKYFWQFYINEECLSVLDDSRYLVNYRQIITKFSAMIDIIDTLSKDKISFEVTTQIVPMTIKHIQLLPIVDSKENNEKEFASFMVRIFSILKHKQATFVMDYDVGNRTVANTYTIENILVEKVSHFDSSNTYSLVNFLYLHKNYIGLLRRHLLKKDQKQEQTGTQLMQELVSTGVEFHMNSLAWNPQLEIILQYRTSVRNQSIHLNKSKVMHKKPHYTHILDQLKLQQPILQDPDFLNHIFQLFSLK